MARYGDLDMLEECMYHEAFEKTSDMQRWDSGCWIRYKMFENVIKSIPTADVVECRRAMWMKSRESIIRPYMCSNCGCLFDVDTVMGKLSWRFCPACGAQMSEGGTNE